MESHEIFEILWNEFTVAREKAAAADRRCMVTIHEVLNGLPSPDGLQRVRNVVRELNSARLEVFEAHARLTAFVVEGIVPDNLKKSVQRDKRSVDLEKWRPVKRGESLSLCKVVGEGSSR
jgi:hypothetical protein